MISTTSQDKKRKNLFYYYLWTLKQNKMPMIVFTLLIMVFGCLWLFIANNNVTTSALREVGQSLYLENNVVTEAVVTEADAQFNIIKSMANQISTVYTFSLMVITMLFTLFAASISFSYLHKKRTLDTFSALPMTRRTMFLSSFLSGITMVLLPLTLITIINMFMFISKPILLMVLFSYYGMIVVSVLAAFSLTALMAVCCGKTADMVTSTLAINIFFPIGVVLFFTAVSVMVPGYNELSNFLTRSPLFIMLMLAFSPYFMAIAPMIQGLSRYNYYEYADSVSLYSNNESTRLNKLFTQISENLSNSGMLNYAIFLIVFAAVFFALALLLVKRRKTESAQTGFAYKFPIYIVRFIISVTIAILGVIIAIVIVNGDGTVLSTPVFYITSLVGTVVGILLSHTIVTLIYNRGFKGFLNSLKAAVVAFAAMLVFGTVLATGFFGVANYSPAAEEIESIEIGSYYSEKIIFKEEESKELILNLHKSVVNQIKYPINPFDLFGSEDVVLDEENVYYELNGMQDFNPLVINYKLKDGRTAERSYTNQYLYSDEIRENIIKVQSTQEYINQLTIFKYSGNSTSTDINIYSNVNIEGSPNLNINTNEDARLFVEALKKDIANDKEFGKNDSKGDKAFARCIINIIDKSNYDHLADDTIVIKMSYTNTINYLQEKKLAPTLMGETIIEEKNLSVTEDGKLKGTNGTLGTIYYNAASLYDMYGLSESDIDLRCMLYDEDGTPLSGYSDDITFVNYEQDNVVSYDVPKIDGVNWAYISFYIPEYMGGYNLISFDEEAYGNIIKEGSTAKGDVGFDFSEAQILQEYKPR